MLGEANDMHQGPRGLVPTAAVGVPCEHRDLLAQRQSGVASRGD